MKYTKSIIIIAIAVLTISIFFTSTVYHFPVKNNNSYQPWRLVLTTGQQEKDNSSVTVNRAVPVSPDQENATMSLPDLFSKVEKSVVQVTNDNDIGISSGRTLGSGFVYDNSVNIVTNYHVIAGSTGNVQITFLDGTMYNARLIGGDPFSDLAVLELEGHSIPSNKLAPLPITDSIPLRIGEQVVAIGNPFGLSGSMTEGIISGLGRMIPSLSEGSPSDIMPPGDQSLSTYSIPDIIQIDAPINPGNSGGPLLNMKGQVIGINTAIFSTTGASAGIGFAIPSNTIKKVVPSLIATGSYQHPYLGIAGTDITPEIAEAVGLRETRGFLVTEVTQGSPAQKAGIRGGNSLTSIGVREIAMGGDIVLKIDDQDVRKIDDILTYLEREKKVGDVVQLTVLRAGETEYISLTLGPRLNTQESQSQSQQEPTTILPKKTFPPDGETLPGPEQNQAPLSDQLYNQCIQVAGKDICDFMFGR